MKKVVIIAILILITLVGYFFYKMYEFTEFLDEVGECVMSDGPVYGDTIAIHDKNLNLEQQIQIPNGKFGFMNLSDSLSPKLIKFDKDDNIIWAIEFKQDSMVLPYQELSKMRLVKDGYGIRLSFSNYSHGEPGVIYLTDEYNVEYMCLSMF